MRQKSLPPPVALDFAAAARRLGHESLGRFQGKSAFLFQLFLAGFDHLIVLRFLDALFNKLLANTLFVFDARRAVSGGRRHHVPLFDDFSVVRCLFRRVGIQGAEQLSTGLIPVCIRELVRVPFSDEGNFARPFFHRIR